MFGLISKIFVWWKDATPGTFLTLRMRGAKQVGSDEYGNRYFEESGKPSFPDGRRRRWVIYHGVAEPSRVPSDWHGWLHHTLPEPPTAVPFVRKKFEKDHLPNMTGTPLAYHPKGSLYHAAKGGDRGVGLDDGPWSPTE